MGERISDIHTAKKAKAKANRFDKIGQNLYTDQIGQEKKANHRQSRVTPSHSRSQMESKRTVEGKKEDKAKRNWFPH